MFKKICIVTFASLLCFSSASYAADYKIDSAGKHAFINFRISHLGYSWLYGSFKDFTGDFTYDETNPNNNKVNVTIDTASIDTEHAERDKHLSSTDFLDVKQFPQATFKSTKIITKGKKLTINGNLTLHGVTKPVIIKAKLVGEGKDPWGGYRAGFYGTTTLKLKDFGIDTTKLGATAEKVVMTLSVEGVRQ